MNTIALQPAHLPSLYTIYRNTIARAAHCRLVPSLNQFAAALTAPSRPQTQVLVAEDGGEVRGFAALLPVQPTDDDPTQATISALFVADELAGQTLLHTCLRIAQERGLHRLTAFDGHHFRCPVPGYNAGWDGLSDTMPMITRLFVTNGFKPTYRELHLSCDLRRFPTKAIATLPGVTVERRVPAEGGWKLVPLVDGKSAGVCEYITLTNMVDDPAAQRVGYIMGLGVAEWTRRQGVGRHLMQHALSHLQELGCDECWLTTGSNNWPAQPLYFKLGFEIVDGSCCFSRDT